MTALGLQPFLIYPAVIKLRHKGNRELRFSESGGFCQLSVSAERMPQLCGGTTAGMDMVLAAQEGMMAG